MKKLKTAIAFLAFMLLATIVCNAQAVVDTALLDSTGSFNFGSIHIPAMWWGILSAFGVAMVTQYAGKLHNNKFLTVLGLVIRAVTLLRNFLIWIESIIPGSNQIKQARVAEKRAVKAVKEELKK